MKKIVLPISIVAAIAIFLATASFVYAQIPNPTDQPSPEWMQNMMGRNGRPGPATMGGTDMMSGENMNAMSAVHTALHDGMVASLAEKLNLTTEELNQRIADGETMWEIAESAGWTQGEFTTWMLETKKVKLDAAVANGVISQEQADWMIERMQHMYGDGFAQGSCHANGVDPSNSTNINNVR